MSDTAKPEPENESLTLQVEALRQDLDECRKARERYRTLLDGTGAAFACAHIISDPQGKPVDYRLLEINGPFARLIGYSPDEATGKTARELMGSIPSELMDIYGQVATTGEPARFEKHMEREDRWFEVFAFSPAHDQFMQVLFDITERKRAERGREDQLHFSQILLDAIPVPVFYKNTQGIYLGGNKAFATFLGKQLDDIVGHSVYGVAPRHLAQVYHQADQELLARGGVQTYETGVRYADGTEHDVIFYKAVFGLREGATDGLVGTILDVTERKQVERGLRESEARYQRQAAELESVYRSAPVGLAVLDDQLRYQRINEQLARINGSTVEAHLGKRLGEMAPFMAETGELLGQRVLTTGEAVWNHEFCGPQSGGERCYVTHWLPLKDDTGRVWGINVVLEETTERKRMEEQTRHMAQHDALTDLPNRRLLLELLDAELRKAQRSRDKIALLFLDLDRFKTINDTLGHAAGDLLLKEVAARLSAKVRRSDVVARLGGDEFTVLLSDLTHEEQAGEIAAGILRTFQAPFNLEQTLYVTTSIGISLYPNDSDTADGLLRCADVAMYDAKEQGRNTFRFYNPAVARRAHERLRIENRLRQAVEEGGLCLHYQPQIELRTGRVVALEALIRWHHPELGILEPGRFIPVAEESDLIASLDDWVLRRACAQAREWLDQGYAPVYVGINLSSKGFENPDLVEKIRRCLREQALSPDHLELEVTERTLMRHVDQTAARMRELVDLGVGIAVDDFGTGYCSMNYLKRLPISKLKIDQSFIRDLETDPDDRAIVEAMTHLGHTLNKQVIAEGVETEAQRALLDAAGCDQGQGYLFTRPQPPEQLGPFFVHP